MIFSNIPCVSLQGFGLTCFLHLIFCTCSHNGDHFFAYISEVLLTEKSCAAHDDLSQALRSKAGRTQGCHGSSSPARSEPQQGCPYAAFLFRLGSRIRVRLVGERYRLGVHRARACVRTSPPPGSLGLAHTHRARECVRTPPSGTLGLAHTMCHGCGFRRVGRRRGSGSLRARRRRGRWRDKRSAQWRHGGLASGCAQASAVVDTSATAAAESARWTTLEHGRALARGGTTFRAFRVLDLWTK
jgi:hypothetical protein